MKVFLGHWRRFGGISKGDEKMLMPPLQRHLDATICARAKAGRIYAVAKWCLGVPQSHIE